MQIIIDIQADDFNRTLSLIQQIVAEPQPILESIGETLLNRNKDRHRKQVDPEGTPWHPLSAKTLARKKTQRMLYEHGDMLGSLHPQSAGNVLTLAFGNEKAKWHHKGTKSKTTNRTRLPARPLLGFPDDDADAVKHLVQDHIEYLLSKRK